MASTIKLKNGSGAPLASDLVQGEPALDLTNKRLYTEDSGGTVIEVGTNPAAEITANAGIALPDNQKATFGAGDDLQIYHDGSHSVIKDAGTGYLKIGLSDQGTAIQNTAGNNLLVTDATDVSLRHDGSEVFTTTSTGIDVTGTVTADALDLGTTTDSATLSTTASDYQLQLRSADSTTGDIGRNISFDSLGNTTAAINTIDAGASSNTHLAFYTGNNASLTERMQISNNGDISFYDSAGSSQSFYWDAADERLGIGTTTPTRTLTVNTGTNNTAASFVSTDANCNISFVDDSTTSDGYVSFGCAGDDAVIRSGNAEAMRIDSSGNVGIGTTSPATAVEISGSKGNGPVVTASISGTTMDVTAVTSGDIEVGDYVFGPNIEPGTRVTALGTGTGGVGTYTVSVSQTAASGDTRISNNAYSTNIFRITSTDTSVNPGQPDGIIQFYGSDTTSPGEGVTAYMAAISEDTSPDTALVFGTRGGTAGVDANERMRITSNGALLVGKTTSGGTTAGMGWLGNEYLQLVNTETGATDRCLLINRQSAEGNLIEFRQANVSVGSIGTRDSGALEIGSGDVYLQFNGTNDWIKPVDGSGNNKSGVDLGTSGAKFDNLYLSGGVVFDDAGGSGTSTSNTLDSYEEGTFTPVLADASSGGNVASISGTQQGYYTKVGNLLYITVIFTDINTTGMTSGNSLYFRGIPFTAVNQGELNVRFDRLTFSAGFVTLSYSAATYARFFNTISNAQDDVLTVAAIDGTASDLFISGVLRVA